MKLNGFVGKGTGKLGASVFAISGGEQIVRQYNPRVSNPNTDAQIEQRAKLKLMSQLAASLAGYIAMAKQGLVSARNQFISKNIGNATFEEGTAKIDLSTLQLTLGNSYLPELGAVTIASGGVATVQLNDAAPENVSKVAYIFAKVNAADELSVIASKVCSTPGATRVFEDTIDTKDNDGVLFAYGFTSFNGDANANYGDYNADVAEDVASLLTSRAVSIASGNLTKTVGKIVN